ncbi:MAG TPA: hypothetical protein VLL76_02950 [Candidatus Omnitrophota bacterium]|nr:hypothetical protein [Candidatus Omnitrophota bacterium]
MDPVSATPAHVLMQQRADREDSHSIKSGEQGAASVFASYAFGPMTLSDGKGGAAKRESKPEGAPTTGNPLSANSMSWVTSVQGLDAGASTGGKKL